MDEPLEASAIFNWCDSRCERCPQEDHCKVAVRMRGRAWAARMRGEDPNSAEVFSRHAGEELDLAMRLIEEAAREDGISLADLEKEPPVPTSLDAVRKERAANECFDAMMAWLAERGKEGPEEGFSLALLSKAKVARLTTYDAGTGIDNDWDRVPNLILLERTLRLVRQMLAAAPESEARARCEQAYDALERLYAPWLENIAPEWRAHIDALIADNRAPSPFCVKASPAAVPDP
jgi:hypothetical protein